MQTLLEMTDRNSTNDARTFAMFSEFFSGENLKDLAVQRIFEKEVFSIRTSGTYMGAWQLLPTF